MSDHPLFDLAEAFRRRDAGIATVKQHNQDWHTRAVEAIRSFENGRIFTCDDLHEVMGADIPAHHNAYGAAIRHASLLKLTIVCGLDKSARPEANARRILQYKRTER